MLVSLDLSVYFVSLFVSASTFFFWRGLKIVSWFCRVGSSNTATATKTTTTNKQTKKNKQRQHTHLCSKNSCVLSFCSHTNASFIQLQSLTHSHTHTHAHTQSHTHIHPNPHVQSSTLCPGTDKVHKHSRGCTQPPCGSRELRHPLLCSARVHQPTRWRPIPPNPREIYSPGLSVPAFCHTLVSQNKTRPPRKESTAHHSLDEMQLCINNMLCVTFACNCRRGKNAPPTLPSASGRISPSASRSGLSPSLGPLMA